MHCNDECVAHSMTSSRGLRYRITRCSPFTARDRHHTLHFALERYNQRERGVCKQCNIMISNRHTQSQHPLGTYTTNHPRHTSHISHATLRLRQTSRGWQPRARQSGTHPGSQQAQCGVASLGVLGSGGSRKHTPPLHLHCFRTVPYWLTC